MGKKRGIFFTGTAIVLALIIILSFKVYYGERLRDKTEITSIRIHTMNNFIKDVEDDLKKGIFIAGFRGMLSMQEYIADNGEFISDLDGDFNEVFLKGTINGIEMDLMKDSTFTDWADRIKAEADKIGIEINFTINDVKINQTDPWNIDIEVDLNLKVEDKKKTSKWDRNNVLLRNIPIVDFEDPLYIVNSFGRVTNTIVKTNLTPFTTDGKVGNLLKHLNNSYYIESASAPNYLMRFQGDLSNSSIGIESLVNLGEFIGQGLSIKTRSAVDYIYFGTLETVNKRVNGTPYWFYLDEGHLKFYNVENITI